MLLEFYKRVMAQDMMSKKENRLDVGFIHASPLIYKEGGAAAASP